MRTLFLFLLIAVSALGQQTPAPARARPNAAQRYALFKNNLVLRGEAITRNQFEGINNLEDWKRRRPEVRRQFLEMLGLDPMPARTPLKARVTGEFQREGYRVQNIVFQSQPGLYVTGNLYLPWPAAAGAKYPAIVYVSGHSPGPAGAKVDYQQHGIWFARNGYVAFLLDTIEFGEIPGIHHGIHNLSMWHWLSLGYTPAGVEVWNAIRSLDYLETRSEADTSKAAITGISGGGAITWFTAAVDDRFQVAAPVLATWAVGPHVAGDTVRQNCDCIYFWNSYQLDLPIVGALIAPRPLKIMNASKDGAFPPAGYDLVYQKLRTVYQWYGAPEKLDEFHAETGHADLPPYRKAADEWINRWLRGDLTPFNEGDIRKEGDSVLTVLDSYPPDAVNEGIHRRFIPAHRLQDWKSLPAWNQRRQELTATLREKVYHAFPRNKAAFDAWRARHSMWTERYADSFNVEFTTEESIRVHGQLFIPRNGKTSHPALIFVRGNDDIIFSVDYDRLLSALADHVVLVLNPRAVDYPMNVNRTSVTKMTAALLGATLESMQLWDILRSVDYLVDEEKLKLSSISVYGRRDMGGLALHAAALDNRISRVILDDPPASHWQAPALLGVLRVTDLPEVAGLVAPREIVSLTPLPEAYQYTRSIFRLHGKPDSIRQAASLGEALKVWEH
ncbi:MAG: acetylxylan esterase [Bryobacteraceae bacterium]|nr:acetylxylan esterase [Bryobacteraceae bacterium]